MEQSQSDGIISKAIMLKSVTDLQKVVNMGIYIIVRRPTELIVLHHVDNCWLNLKIVSCNGRSSYC